MVRNSPDIPCDIGVISFWVCLTLACCVAISVAVSVKTASASFAGGAGACSRVSGCFESRLRSGGGVGDFESVESARVLLRYGSCY